MILGIGTDIASLERIEKGLARFGGRFEERILSGRELASVPSGTRRASFLAGRWAAKEACAKALGTGFAGGIGPTEIAIVNDALGAPRLVLEGAALARLRRLGCTRTHVSISHDAGSAVAFVVLEG